MGGIVKIFCSVGDFSVEKMWRCVMAYCLVLML